MRSTDHPISPVARRFGELVAEYAERAGYEVEPGSGGRARLARDIGMSASAVGRMLDGKALPMPHQMESIARTVGAEVRTLLITAGVISEEAWPKGANRPVLSATPEAQPPTPEAVADMWGITDPGIRAMLIGSAHHAIRLQHEATSRAEQGQAVGRR